jgi:hypothetical protein
MRVAFLLCGKIGGMKGKDGEGGLIDYHFCRDRFNKYIIEPNNADVFIHSWSKAQEKDLMEIYSPKKAIIENQIDFKFNHHLPFLGGKKGEHPFNASIVRSRFYSTQKVVKLKKAYEKKNGFIYDFVMITRFDLIWHTLINFNKLDSRYFYIPKWNKVDYGKERTIKRKYFKGERYLDLCFISNSKYMNYYGDAFNKFKNNNISDPHTFLHIYLNENKKIKRNVKFRYLRAIDMDVYRDRVESYKNGRTILKRNFTII